SGKARRARLSRSVNLPGHPDPPVGARSRTAARHHSSPRLQGRAELGATGPAGPAVSRDLDTGSGCRPLTGSLPRDATTANRSLGDQALIVNRPALPDLSRLRVMTAQPECDLVEAPLALHLGTMEGGEQQAGQLAIYARGLGYLLQLGGPRRVRTRARQYREGVRRPLADHG